MPFPYLPVAAGLGVGLGVLALRNHKKNAAAQGAGPVPPSGPPASVIPAAKAAALPVITQTQFDALSALGQQNVIKDAKDNILTLTAKNGTLFVDKPRPENNAIGIIKDADVTANSVLTVAAEDAARNGISFAPVLQGNILLQALADASGGMVQAKSLDVRVPDKVFTIPVAIINGAGDP